MVRMNAKQFLEKFSYALESDFSSAGNPATWAPKHPKYWGQEKAKIPIGVNTNTVALSPDDKFVAVGIDRAIHIFDVTTQELVEVLRAHSGTVEKVQFSPALVDENQRDARYKMASQADENVGEEEPVGTIILWDLNEHGRLVSTKERMNPVDPDVLTQKTVQSLVSELTAKHGWDASEKAIGIIDEAMRNALRTAVDVHEREDKISFRGELASFESPAFSPDGKTLIYIGQNDSTQEELRNAASLPSVNLWDVESKTLRHELLGHTDSIMWTSMSPDSTRLASLSWDGTARVWDADPGACIHVLGPFGGQLWRGAFSPDGKYLVISQGSPKTHIHVYEIDTERPISRFDGFGRWARSLSWSPDGTMLAGGSEDGTLCIWDPFSGQEKMQWRLAIEDRMMRCFAHVRGLQFVDGGRKLMFQLVGGTVEVYDFESNTKQQFTRKAEDQIEKSPYARVVCSADSKLLVIPDADGSLRLWDLRLEQEEINVFPG